MAILYVVGTLIGIVIVERLVVVRRLFLQASEVTCLNLTCAFLSYRRDPYDFNKEKGRRTTRWTESALKVNLQRPILRFIADNLLAQHIRRVCSAFIFASTVYPQGIPKSEICRCPRRRLMISLCSGINAALILYVVLQSLNKLIDETKYGCLVCFLIYGLAYGCGVGSLSCIMSSELVPQRHRSRVQSVVCSIYTVLLVITTFTVLPLYDKINSYAFVILYIVPNTFSIYYLYRYLPETRDREIYEIVDELRKKK